LLITATALRGQRHDYALEHAWSKWNPDPASHLQAISELIWNRVGEGPVQMSRDNDFSEGRQIHHG